MSITKQEDGVKQDFHTIKKSFHDVGILFIWENMLIRARERMMIDFRNLMVVNEIQKYMGPGTETVRVIAHGDCNDSGNFWRNCNAYAVNDKQEWHIMKDEDVPSELMELMKKLNLVLRDMPIFSKDAEMEIREPFAAIYYGEFCSKGSYSPEFLTFISSMVSTEGSVTKEA